MYAFIRGKFVKARNQQLILDVNGIGYAVSVPAYLVGKGRLPGEEVLLHVSFVVREMSQSLYGFQTEEERDLFEQLMEVSGVGAKLALAILGHIEVRKLQQAIHQRDVPALCKVPGIGKKTAERLILDLKEKLKPLQESHLSVANIPLSPKEKTIRDAMSALINLGYGQSAAQKAIQTALDQDCDDEDLSSVITKALQIVQN